MSVVDSAQQLVLNGPLLVAAPIAFAAGALSFFSPCCLPLVPGYLSFVTGSIGADAIRRSTPTPSPPGATGEAFGTVSDRSGGGLVTDARPRSTVAVRSKRRPGRGRTMLGAFLFVLGFAAVFTSYGAAFGGLGTLLLSHQQTLTRVLAGVSPFW